MSDFWLQHDKSYRLFSQYCDTDDWHNILKAVAGAITEVAKPKCQMSLLDVGCGTGIATETICERIFSNTKNFPQLTVVEPSQVARSRVAANLLYQSEGGVLRNVYASLNELPENARFDVIMFLHSTYYIRNFQATIKVLVERHLYPGGKIVMLVLPEESSFFLQLTALQNCMSGVKHDLQSIGLHDIKDHHLQSRFLLPESYNLTENEWKSLCQFFRPEGIELEQFKKLIKRDMAINNSLDFQDYLVTGKKPKK